MEKIELGPQALLHGLFQIPGGYVLQQGILGEQIQTSGQILFRKQVAYFGANFREGVAPIEKRHDVLDELAEEMPLKPHPAMGREKVQDLFTGLIRRITVYVVMARDSQSL